MAEAVAGVAAALADQPLTVRVAALAQASEAILAPLDVETLTTGDAAALVTPVDRLVRQVTAARTELVGRASEAGALRSSLSGLTKTPDRWAADELGIPLSQAKREIATAERLRKHTSTRDAFRAGDLSPSQADAITEAASLAPRLEESLLESVARQPGELQQRCRDIKARHAGKAGEAARAERHRKRRRLLRSETDDLAAQALLVVPATWGARLDALLQPFLQDAVDTARLEQRREPPEAHLADALFLALETANTHRRCPGPNTAAGPGPGPGPGTDPDSGAGPGSASGSGPPANTDHGPGPGSSADHRSEADRSAKPGRGPGASPSTTSGDVSATPTAAAAERAHDETGQPGTDRLHGTRDVHGAGLRLPAGAGRPDRPGTTTDVARPKTPPPGATARLDASTQPAAGPSAAAGPAAAAEPAFTDTTPTPPGHATQGPAAGTEDDLTPRRHATPDPDPPPPTGPPPTHPTTPAGTPQPGSDPGANTSAHAGRPPGIGNDSGSLPDIDSPRPDAAPVRPTTGRGSGHTARWGGTDANVIVHIDLTALNRGHVRPDERSHLQVNGNPPTPVTHADIADVLDTSDPLIALVLRDGTDIHEVHHLGRRPNALQRTALDALHQRCAATDCGRHGFLEADHIIPVEEGGPTTLDNLTLICPTTHDAKTHHDHHLRPIPHSHHVELLPPDHPDHPRNNPPAP